MMRYRDCSLLAVFFASAALLGWATPPGSDYVSWAPDGQRAYVQLTRDHVTEQMVVDSSGNVLWSQADAKDAGLAWMPDSRHVIVARNVAPKSWDDYAHVLGQTRSLYVMAAASGLAELIAGNAADWTEFDCSQPLKDWSAQLDSLPIDRSQVFYYLEQTRAQLVMPLVAAAKQGPMACGGVFDDVNVADPTITELLLRDATPAADASEQLLARSTHSIYWADPSPAGDAVAYWDPYGPRLSIASVRANAQPLNIAGAGDWIWSTDGQQLAYTHVVDNTIHWITQVKIRDRNGELLEEPGRGEELARTPPYVTLVAGLADGRILFMSDTTQLPALASASTEGWTFYALRTQPTIAVERIVPDSVQWRFPSAAHFVISPDAAKVAIYGTNDGSVSVFFINTGKFVSLQSARGTPGMQLDEPLPSWRTADELSYLIPAGDPAGSQDRAEVAVVSLRDGTKRVISKSWPDSSLLPRLKK